MSVGNQLDQSVVTQDRGKDKKINLGSKGEERQILLTWQQQLNCSKEQQSIVSISLSPNSIAKKQSRQMISDLSSPPLSYGGGGRSQWGRNQLKEEHLRGWASKQRKSREGSESRTRRAHGKQGRTKKETNSSKKGASRMLPFLSHLHAQIPCHQIEALFGEL